MWSLRPAIKSCAQVPLSLFLSRVLSRGLNLSSSSGQGPINCTSGNGGVGGEIILLRLKGSGNSKAEKQMARRMERRSESERSPGQSLLC